MLKKRARVLAKWSNSPSAQGAWGVGELGTWNCGYVVERSLFLRVIQLPKCAGRMGSWGVGDLELRSLVVEHLAGHGYLFVGARNNPPTTGSLLVVNEANLTQATFGRFERSFADAIGDGHLFQFA